MFIEVHNQDTKDSGECFVNIDQIKFISKSRDGTARIQFGGQNFFSSIETVESYDKIKAMMGR